MHYNECGYKCDAGDIINVDVKDLNKYNTAEVKYQCDRCYEVNVLSYRSFAARHNINEPTYCTSCANQILDEKRKKDREQYQEKNGYKKCARCNKIYPANSDYFYKHKTTKDGWNNFCKECFGGKFTNFLIHIPKDGYHFCKKCNRELPYTFQYFPEDKTCKKGLRNVCRECNDSYGHFLEHGQNPRRAWSDKDLNLLRSIYADYTGKELKEKFFPDRTVKSIESIADIYGFPKKTDETCLRARASQAAILSESMKGRILNSEWRKHISESKKEYYKTHDVWAKGKSLSESHKKQISDCRRAKGAWKGKKNPRHINPLCGELNGRWKGGILPFYTELRSDTKDWFKESIEFCNYKCVITGLNFDNCHHTTAFYNIVEETFELSDLDKRNKVSDYTVEEFNILRNILKKLHSIYGYGACINKDVHKLFHDNYGYKDFSPYDFLDFCYRIDLGEFKEWFIEHNLEINLNYSYIEYLENTLNELDKGEHVS